MSYYTNPLNYNTNSSSHSIHKPITTNVQTNVQSNNRFSSPSTRVSGLSFFQSIQEWGKMRNGSVSSASIRFNPKNHNERSSGNHAGLVWEMVHGMDFNWCDFHQTAWPAIVFSYRSV